MDRQNTARKPSDILDLQPDEYSWIESAQEIAKHSAKAARRRLYRAIVKTTYVFSKGALLVVGSIAIYLLFPLFVAPVGFALINYVIPYKTNTFLYSINFILGGIVMFGGLYMAYKYFFKNPIVFTLCLGLALTLEPVRELIMKHNLLVVYN